MEVSSEARKYVNAQNGVLNFKGEPASKEKTGRWFGSIPMLVIQSSVTIIFFGIVSNLVTYMTGVLHRGVSQSARDINNLQGTWFVFSVLGAFLSDTYWGRYKTMLYAFLLFNLGLSCLTISASLKNLRPPSCPANNYTCEPATDGQTAFFFLSLYAIALAGGGMTACLTAFGADQFDESDDSERRQKSSFFNLVLCSIHIGGIFSVTILVYLEDHVGWSWGYGVLLFFLALAMVVFFVQTQRYRYRAPDGSPLTKIAQVLVAAFRKRNLALPPSSGLHEEEYVSKGKRRTLHTSDLRFLDKAAVIPDDDSKLISSPWKLSTVTRVEEVKLVIRMMPIWLSTLWFTTAPSQSATFFVRQGMTMDNRLGSFKVPPASMLVINNLSVVIFLTFYDRLLVPALRKVTRNERGISLLQRTGTGILVSVIALVIAALVELKRKHDDSKLTIFWLAPQYAILGVAEGLANTGLLEFYHEQSPDTFHSLGISLALLNLGAGSFLSSVLITCVNKAAPTWLQNDLDKGHLELFYWLLAGLSVVSLAFYVPLARWYSYKRTEEYSET